MSAWKSTLSWIGAILLALLFTVSGLWKLTDASGAAVRMAQARVPQSLSLAAAIGFGIAETFTAVLLLVPRFRRWGAWLAGALLVAFMIFIGVNYNALRGADCSCFPWVKRAVGPGFFIGDGVMLLMAVFAGAWSRRPVESRRAPRLRTAVAILGVIALFAAGSYGFAAMRQTGTKAPDTVTVDGQPYSLEEARFSSSISTRSVCTAWTPRNAWRSSIGTIRASWPCPSTCRNSRKAFSTIRI